MGKLDNRELEEKLELRKAREEIHFSDSTKSLITDKFIEYVGDNNELLVRSMEECGELIQSCSKAYRNNRIGDIELQEEIADVEICLSALKKIINKEEDIKYVSDIKYDSLLGRMLEEKKI